MAKTKNRLSDRQDLHVAMLLELVRKDFAVLSEAHLARDAREMRRDERLDELAEDMKWLKVSQQHVIRDLGLVRTDVSVLKSDVAELKTGQAEMRIELRDLSQSVARHDREIIELKSRRRNVPTRRGALKS